jgi:hypothetical protein
MKTLVHEKERAVFLRKKGFSYKEILREVAVAKSSLSLWLKDLPLTKKEKQYLKVRKESNISRGRIKAASVLHQNRLLRERRFLVEAKELFKEQQFNPLFHTGVALYWAEGAKRSTVFHFVNSDAEMINIMLNWIEKFTQHSRLDLGYRLYIQMPYANQHCEEWWAEELRVPLSKFKKTIYKPTGLLIKKRPNYKGCLRIEVPKSKPLLVKMKFWINMLVEQYP